MKGARTGLTVSLGAIGILVAAMLLVARKGPVAGLAAMLAVSVIVVVFAVIEGLVKRKDG